MSRRDFLQTGAAGLALAAAPAFIGGCSAAADVIKETPAAAPPPGADFARFGVDPDDCRRVLGAALSRGGDHAELFFQHRAGNWLGLEDGRVDRASTSVDLGVGVRVVKGAQFGYAFTEELSEARMRAAAQTAASISVGGAGAAATRNHHVATPAHYPTRVPWDGVDADRKLPLLQHVDRVARATDPRIRRVSVNLVDEHSVILIVRSDGRVVQDVQPMTTCVITCVAEHGDRREEGFYRVGMRAGFELYEEAYLDRIAQAAVARTVLLFDASQPPAGEMPVVLAAGSSGILLHEAIGHGMEADFNRKRVSIYADRMGKPIASELVTIVDDGTNQGMRGSINVDDEGEATAHTVLVDRGVLASYMHDRISAAHYGVAPTGNGRRESFRHPPLPRMRNTSMLAGPHTHDEIVASVKRGLYAQSFSNGQVQIGAGDFTFYVKTGFLIEDGRLTRPVKDVNLVGNGPRVLEQIDMVADDAAMDEGSWTCGKGGQRVPVGLGMPTVRVAAITVGGVNP